MNLRALLNEVKITCEQKIKSLLRSNATRNKAIVRKYFSTTNEYVKDSLRKKCERENFIQLKHSDSAAKFEKNGIMKANNWPKKKNSKKKNELYLLMNRENNRNVNFHELNVVMTKKIDNMQNIKEVYKFIYYNKDILVPINYVICIYKIYKLVKKNDYKIVNHHIYVNKSIMGIDIERLNDIARVGEIAEYNELYDSLESRGANDGNSDYEIKSRGSLPRWENTKDNLRYHCNSATNAFCLDYSNDIFQYVLEKINKNFFIKKLTYRHISNLLFSLVNLKYYNMATYLIYVKYINSMYLHLSSQAVSNITYAYALLFNFYSVNFTINYQDYVYKYYTFLSENGKDDLQKDCINFMFLLLSRCMCIMVTKHLNNLYSSRYALSSFYDGNLSNWSELNEKEMRCNKPFAVAGHSTNVGEAVSKKDRIFQEFFVFLWSMSKINVNNIYIDLLCYLIYRSRKNIMFKLNEKDVCNLMQSVSVYYPIKKLSRMHECKENYEVSLTKGEENPFFLDYDIILRNALLLTIFHVEKFNYHQYSIIFKCAQNLQNFLTMHSEEDKMGGFHRDDNESYANYLNEEESLKRWEELPNERFAVISMRNMTRGNWEGSTVGSIPIARERVANSPKEILKKLTTRIINNLIAKMEEEEEEEEEQQQQQQEKESVSRHFYNSKRERTSLNIQHLSIYLFNLSHMSELYVKKELRNKFSSIILTILEKKIGLSLYFDNENVNIKIIDDYIQKRYDNLVCLSNINYALNKSNIVNESIILGSSLYFYKMYHTFYNIYKYTQNDNYFFNFIEKVRERILSIFNWTYSNTNISYIPLQSLINYNYLYMIYKNHKKDVFIFLKKMLLPITLYNNITINQLRLILKMLTSYYISFFIQNNGDICMYKLHDCHDDMLTCMYSLCLIVTNILHNTKKNTYDICGDFNQLHKDEHEYVLFYINFAINLAKCYFYQLYSINESNIQKYILKDIKNKETIMKFYTFYLFVKIHMTNRLMFNRNCFYQFLHVNELSKRKFCHLERLLCTVSSEQNYPRRIAKKCNSDLGITTKKGGILPCVNTQDDVKRERKVSTVKGGKNTFQEKVQEDPTYISRDDDQMENTNQSGKTFIYSYINNIYNKNYLPDENFQIFYLLQKRIYPLEKKLNRKCVQFLKHHDDILHVDLFNSRLANDVKKVEDEVILTFRQIKSSKSHIKLYEYIKKVLQKKHGKNGEVKLKNEYIIDKNSLKFVVDIYDKNTNTIFEVNGISHYTKQYLSSEGRNSSSFFYNYKSYYIFKHFILSGQYNIVYLPLHEDKLCKDIITHYYGQTAEDT
ncbi:conserved Plasmodium protein, unknown function [Plasmodium ovale]|uniref:RAP protein n=2 Tax=Plasmodium ovale TaxID=36330 RepID=A0A1A8WHP4_PLAOA|nr:conserved Plasmodium protein, unknown function [Plasmodium ovale curtisi]SBS93618.1 conserved Plasmodium protein, unknown function [Plasmodium ovale curtisi]SCQ16429.1 conserved Plasmodium protein, unknown function [Plasmodium ovale]